MASNQNIGYIPSKDQHTNRNIYNKHPVGDLTFYGMIDEWGQNVYVDESGKRWHELKWYNSIYHNPIKNIKMQYYHSDIPEYCHSLSSSEIIVPKSKLVHGHSEEIKIYNNDIKIGSYNFKDFKKAGRIKHFLADVFPVVLYCSCIGE